MKKFVVLRLKPLKKCVMHEIYRGNFYTLLILRIGIWVVENGSVVFVDSMIANLCLIGKPPMISLTHMVPMHMEVVKRVDSMPLKWKQTNFGPFYLVLTNP